MHCRLPYRYVRMKFILKFFPEITIKSGPVRKRMSRQLTENLRILLRRFDAGATVLHACRIERSQRVGQPPRARPVLLQRGRE